MMSSSDGFDGGGRPDGIMPAHQSTSNASVPPTVAFLRQVQLDPRSTNYHVSSSVISQLYRSLWTSIFSHVAPAHLLPRDVAPTTMHALVFLERCGWKLGQAQKRALVEINDRRREMLGSLAPVPSSSSSSSISPRASPQPSGKGRTFAPPRQATPPPGLNNDELLGPEYGIDRKGMPCGHIFKKGEAIYRCRDCALDDTCVMCAPCFNSSNHEGHDIVFNVSNASGGCCDCGDEEAWTRKVSCKYHDAEYAQSGHPMQEAGPSGREADRGHNDRYDQVLGESSHEKGKAPERKTNYSDHIQQVEDLLGSVPVEARKGLISQVSTMIAFVLNTMEHAPADMKLEEGPDAIEAIKKQTSLEPVEDDPLNDYTPSPVGAYSFDSGAQSRSYTVVLWNDEKHSFREVIDIVSEATGKTELEAKSIAERVDRHGREFIETSAEVRRLYLLAHKLGQIDLAVTVRPAYDVFTEEIAGHVLEMILDLANASISIVPPHASGQSMSTHPLDNLVPNAAVMRALISRALLDEWIHRATFPNSQMSLEFFDTRHLLQLDGLLLMDHKLWKSARANLCSLYMALIGPREVKRAFSYRFACMFPKIVETFILHDREPEHSVRFIAVQIFSVPSIASELVARQDFFHKVLQMLQAIFTGQTTTGALILPATSSARMQANPQSMLVRQQRCHPILQDLRYLLAAEGVQRQIVQDTQHLGHFADFLSLFNAIAPDRRAIAEHVEYESEIWIPILHVATYLARLSKLFGEAYARATPAQLVEGLGLQMDKTLHSSTQLHQNDPDTHAAIAFNRVNFVSHSYHTIDFCVETMGVSFYHPMHWLIAEMLKSVAKLDRRSLQELGRHDLADSVPSDIGENGLLVLFDFPLRVVVKLAQIRAGLWVRNGFGIRSQAHHYRDNNMREIMLDQDIFMLQCSLAFINPDRMLVTFAQRFSLVGWLQGTESTSTTMDVSQTLFLAEEMMLLLVTLLSETSMAADWSIEDQLRREIIHFLALNQGTYSELTRYISDRLKDHASFDRILAQVSNFRAPDGTNDLGIFELKSEYYEHVQPFFFHYTRNQREKAEQVLKERQKRKTSSEEAARFVVVPLPQLSGHVNILLEKLKDVFLRPVFCQILYLSLSNASFSKAEVPDGLVEAALQLILLGLVERQEQFARCLLTSNLQLNVQVTASACLAELLLSMRSDRRFSAFKPKIEWILAEAARADPVGCGSFVQNAAAESGALDRDASQASADDKRKAAAKARQAAIMQQFSAQQKSLLDSLEQDDDEEMTAEDDAMEVAKEDEKAEVGFGSCIFCQEDLSPAQAFGCLTHVQGSRSVRNTPRHDANSLRQSLQTPLTLDRNGRDGKRQRGWRDDSSMSHERAYGTGPRPWEGFPSEDRRFGFYTSTCGHMMHLECFDVYNRSIEQRHAQQIARNHPEDLSRSEFVCPLCKSLGNIILPVPKAAASSTAATPAVDQTPLTDWIRKINIDILKTSTSSLRADMQETEHGTGCFTHWFAEDAQAVMEASRARGTENAPSQANQQMLERFCGVLKPLSSKTRATRVAHQSRTILAPPSRKMYIPEEVVAYTIDVLEIAQRGTAPLTKAENVANSATVTVADSTNKQTNDLIVALIQCLREIAKIEEPNHQSIMRHGLLMRLLPHWGGQDTVRSPLLLRDPLTILVETAAIIPENVRQVTVLMFYVQLVQVIFGIAQPSLWPQGGSAALSRIAGLRSAPSSDETRADEASPSADCDADTLALVFDDVRGMVANTIGLVGYARGNITLGVDNLDDSSLAKMICTYCLPFLRRASILQRSIGVLPDASESIAGSESTSEFLRLMKLMSIPLPRESLSANATRQTALAGLVEGWIKHAYPQLASIFRPLPIQPSPLSASSKVGNYHHHNYHPTLQLEHPHIYELIRLPTNLTTLLTQCQLLKCKRCGDPPPEPAICLECGDLLCFQSFCCQGTIDGHGECNRHIEECGHSTGMFFKIKSNIIVLLFQGKGCFTYSPYLDSHGEIDIGLKKGKIQYLHTVRFDEMRKQWLQHGLPNMIARKIEAVMDQGGWTTM